MSMSESIPSSDVSGAGDTAFEIVSMIPTLLLAMIAVLTVFGVLLGLMRGLRKSVMRVITIAAALVLALIISGSLTPMVSEYVLPLIDEEFLEILDSLPSVLPFVLGLVRPLAFVIVFFALTIVLWFVYFFLSIVLSPKARADENGKKIPPKKRRLFGALVGGAQGFLVAAVLLTPLLGYFSLATDMMETVIESADPEDAMLEDVAPIYEDVLLPIRKSFPVNTVTVVTKPLFRSVSSFRLDGDKVNLEEELGIFYSAIQRITSLSDSEGLGEKEVGAIREVMKLLEESTLFTSFATEAVAGMGEAWQNDEEFLSIGHPSIDEQIDPLFDGLSTIFATTTKDTLAGDIDSFLDLLDLVVAYGLTEGEGDDFFTKMTTPMPENGDKTFVTAALDVLDANPRMAPLRSGITAIGMSVVGEQLNLGTPEEIRENYGELATEAVEILRDLPGETSEEKIEALKTPIQEELARQEIEVPEEIVEEASRFFLDELEKKDIALEDVTEEDIFAILELLSSGADSE